ncbi:MAG: energy-coupling factor ABC transporter permease [Burkholderiales bacterium]
MDVALAPLAPAWVVATSIATLVLLGWAAWAAPWRRLMASSEAASVWCGSIFALTVLWSVRAVVQDAMVIHLLGTAGFALAAGAPLALIGGAVVALASALVHGTPLAHAPAVFLTSVALPAAVALSVLRASQRLLPPNFFVYTIVACFLGGALGCGLAGLASAVQIALTGAVDPEVVFGDYVPYLLYLAFGEGTLTGMMLTLAVVYRPQWVATFDDAFYLHRSGG